MVKKLADAVGKDCTLTVAGGVTTVDDVSELHKLGVEAQVAFSLTIPYIS